MKILLINMPFSDINRPSLSLSQLKYLLDQKQDVHSEIFYANMDFAEYLGLEAFEIISTQYTSGVGDWFFRQVAFPHLEDNVDAFINRHFPMLDAATRRLVDALIEKRRGLDGFMDQLIDRYQLADAAIAGFTSMFSQNVASFAMAKKLKDRNGAMVTAMGGANCETPMGEVLVRNVPQIDFVFSGPALVSFPSFVDHQLQGRDEDCHRIKGVFSKQNVDQLTRRAVVGEELPLDVPIHLDYRAFANDFNQLFPQLTHTKVLTFETSRGCWWGERSHCTFCGINGDSMAYRSMSPDRAIEQFERIFSYAPYFLTYSCVDNIIPRAYPKDVFPKLNPPEEIRIFYEVKADLKEAEMALLSEKRVKSIQPGIESLATSTLKLMKKGTSAFGNVTFLKNCVRFDMAPEWNLLVGFPGEPEQVFQKYLDDMPKLVHLPPPSGCFPVRFDRFSPYFTKAEQYELDLQPYDFYAEIYPFEPEAIATMAYYFQDHNFKTDYKASMSRWLAKLQRAVAQWNSRWDDADSLQPELYFRDHPGSNQVVDTRMGIEMIHAISPVQAQVLHILKKPTALSSLARVMKDWADFNPEKEVAQLKSKGLLFLEGTRYLSLVVDTKGSDLRVQRGHTLNK